MVASPARSGWSPFYPSSCDQIMSNHDDDTKKSHRSHCCCIVVVKTTAHRGSSLPTRHSASPKRNSDPVYTRNILPKTKDSKIRDRIECKRRAHECRDENHCGWLCDCNIYLLFCHHKSENAKHHKGLARGGCCLDC